MNMRKSSFFALAAMTLAVACGPRMYSSLNTVADEQPDGGSYTERIVPVVTKIAPDSQVTLRFYDDMPNVAYISAADFQAIVVPGSQMTVTHTGAGEYTLANGDAKATVNINSDVFTSDQFEAFTNQMGLLQPGLANVYYDGLPFVRYKSVTYFPATATTTLDYGAYGIDIRSDGKGAVYFPFATLADMYTDLYYHHAGFNGEKVVANLSVNEVSLSKIDPDYYKPILAQTTRPADLAEFNYKELCFGMDHFYGYPGRVTYNDELKAKGLDKTLEEDIEAGPAIKKLLLSEKQAEYLFGMTGLTAVYFDGHTAMEVISDAVGEDREGNAALITAYQMTGMANQEIIALLMNAIAPMQEMSATSKAVEVLRPRAYGQATYVKVGDTAVCVFDSFNSRNEKAWKDYYAGNGPMPTVENTENDDMVIFLDALNKAAADPEVKNFIVDITNNGGGSADIVMAMTSLILDKSYISMDNPLTGQHAMVQYEVDRNFNGAFDEADKDVRYDLNFAVLTSGMSFSCGNLFPSMLKDAGIPVIGETSGGGACAIQAMCTADGYCFQISSFRGRLNTLEGENIDAGVTPDFPIAVGESVEIPVMDLDTNTVSDTLTVKDYSKYFEIDYLKELVEKGKE